MKTKVHFPNTDVLYTTDKDFDQLGYNRPGGTSVIIADEIYIDDNGFVIIKVGDFQTMYAHIPFTMTCAYK